MKLLGIHRLAALAIAAIFIGAPLAAVAQNVATNAPASIYSYHTHGCVRLDPDNIKDLFGRISKGAPGMIIYEPVLFAKTDDGRLFLEVDRDIYEDGGATLDDVKHVAASLKISDLVDWSAVSGIVDSHDGIAHDVTAGK